MTMHTHHHHHTACPWSIAVRNILTAPAPVVVQPSRSVNSKWQEQIRLASMGKLLEHVCETPLSTAELAKLAGLSLTTTQGALARLSDSGIVKRTTRMSTSKPARPMSFWTTK